MPATTTMTRGRMADSPSKRLFLTRLELIAELDITAGGQKRHGEGGCCARTLRPCDPATAGKRDGMTAPSGTARHWTTADDERDPNHSGCTPAAVQLHGQHAARIRY